jgi:hypothetical protein
MLKEQKAGFVETEHEERILSMQLLDEQASYSITEKTLEISSLQVKATRKFIATRTCSGVMEIV